MCDMYTSFLQRAVEYRKKLNLTQVEASKELGITQSQLSKMELGKTIYSYAILRSWHDRKWDVDQIFTGKRYDYTVAEVWDKLEVAEEKERKQLLRLAAWGLRQGIEKSHRELDRELEFELELLEQLAAEQERGTMLYEIRILSGITQIPMSERLGVNIKKYRMLERNKTKPDAELLLRIYEETGCRPSLLLEPENVEKRIISDLWQLIDAAMQEKILAFMEQGAAVLRS